MSTPAARPMRRIGRELRYFLLVGGFGVLVLPLLIYGAGALTLGPYEAGIGAFLGNVYGDFVTLSPAAAGLLLGPYVLFLVLRVLLRPFRSARTR